MPWVKLTPPRKLPSGWLPSVYCPLDNCPPNFPLDIFPRIELHFRWLVACIIAPGINGLEENPLKNCHMDRLHPRYFSRRIRNSSTLVVSSFFLLFFFGVSIVQEFDFCIRKNFINTLRLKLLRKEEKVKSELTMEQWNRFVYVFPADRDWQGLLSKSL